MTRLAGRRALITGADGGIGSTLARGLAAEGCALALHAHHAGGAEALAAELRAAGGVAHAVTGDVRVRADVDAFVADALDALGGLDILVNNAGVMSTASFLEMSEAEWERTLGTNLGGYFHVGQAVARHMVGSGAGSIVNVASTRQVQAWPGSAAYATSKAAIAMLTRSMALELAPHGVRVNSIAPGTFLTDLNRDYLSDEEFAAARIRTIPAGRLGRTEELIAAVVYLCSDDASFTVGASIMIDGGQTLW